MVSATPIFKILAAQFYLKAKIEVEFVRLRTALILKLFLKPERLIELRRSVPRPLQKGQRRLAAGTAAV
jgi:hypothetical protein